MGLALLQIHIHQQHLAIPGLGHADSKTCGGSCNPATVSATGQSHQFGVVALVLDLKMRMQAITQSFIKRAQCASEIRDVPIPNRDVLTVGWMAAGNEWFVLGPF